MRFALSILFLFVVLQVASAQLTITEEDINNIKGTSQYMLGDTSGNVSVNTGSSGANQVWDFSSLNQGNMQIRFDFIEPQGTPFLNEFPEANFVLSETMEEGDLSFSLYNYYTVTPSSFIQHGLGIQDPDGQFSEIVLERDVAPLPLTYESEWSIEYADTSEFIGITTITNHSRHSVIDAWGTIITPAGSFDCLRMRVDYTEVSDYYIQNMLAFSETSSGIDYTWIGHDAFIFATIESQDGEADPNYTVAESYLILNDFESALAVSDPDAGPDHFNLIRNYPNPFNAMTTIYYRVGADNLSPLQVDLSIFNISGQKLITLVSESQTAGSYQVRWDAGDFPSGTYFVRLTAVPVSGTDAARVENIVQYKKVTLIR